MKIKKEKTAGLMIQDVTPKITLEKSAATTLGQIINEYMLGSEGKDKHIPIKGLTQIKMTLFYEEE